MVVQGGCWTATRSLHREPKCSEWMEQLYYNKFPYFEADFT